MKLRCLLIDDEPPALKVLATYISTINGLEIAGQCKNAVEALDVLQNKSVDVIFLDIKMPHIIGTEFLKNLAQELKRVCGTGGTASDDGVELQGDQRDRVRVHLQQKGYTVKG